MLDSINLDAANSLEELTDIIAELSALHTYAMAKRYAVSYRLAGKIRSALSAEARCEVLYKALPENLKW